MENGTHEFDLQKLESDPEHISKTKLYKIMKDQILRVLRGKKGEKEVNIIFFLPYPLAFDSKKSFIPQYTLDFLDVIYEKLKEEIFLGKRKIYVIYPSFEINTFVLRNMCEKKREYITHDKLAKYFTFEIIDSIETMKND